MTRPSIKDIGPRTAAIAKAMTRYDPDPNWQKVAFWADTGGADTPPARNGKKSEPPRWMGEP